jgi:hypothetical protein
MRNSYEPEGEQIDEIAPLAAGAAIAGLAAAPYVIKKVFKPKVDKALDKATQTNKMPLATGGTQADLRKVRGLNNSFEAEGENIEERTRYAKETGKDPQTGKPSVKGGEEPPSAMKHLQKKFRDTGGMRSSRGQAIQPQGKKKEKGKKGPKGVTPVDKIRGKLARKRAPKPNIGSRFD